MHVARGGYVGAARGEHGKTILAAALPGELLRRHRSPGAAVISILATTGLDALGDTSEVCWQGTPALTSRARRVAAERLFVVGDSAGYVEPFTGEGIAWAAECAILVTPLVARACERWTPALAAEWERSYRCQVRRRQLVCQMLAALLRCPWAVSLAMDLVRGCPPVADGLIRRLNQSPRGRFA
jgi:2-polyprenyl-6-methoxyphenol hydroxylase-like FAD-dependent oxidoreductase